MKLFTVSSTFNLKGRGLALVGEGSTHTGWVLLKRPDGSQLRLRASMEIPCGPDVKVNLGALTVWAAKTDVPVGTEVIMHDPFRVFYKFQPFMVGQDKFKWELCFLVDKRQWSPSLLKFQKNLNHWQFAKVENFKVKSVFEVHQLASIQVLAKDLVGLNYDHPIVDKRLT